MVARSVRKLGLVAAMGLVFSACASSGGEAAGAADAAAPATPGAVQLEVRNNAFGAQDAVILLTGGNQQSLGNVPAGQNRTFTLQLEPRSYSLSARTNVGQTNTSFSLFATTTRIVWDMSTNRVTQTSR